MQSDVFVDAMKPTHVITRFILIMLCLACIMRGGAQQKKLDADTTNGVRYYKLAKHLLTFDDRDSLRKAWQVLRMLHYLDSSKYSTGLLKQAYSKIENTNYCKLIARIRGKWKFEWYGNNFFTIETYKTRNEKVWFKKRNALFYHGDTLIRKTRYCITNKFSPRGMKEFVFQVYFYDNSTANNISFRTAGADYNAGLKLSKENIAMYFSTTDMATDSEDIIYMKASASGYRLGQP